MSENKLKLIEGAFAPSEAKEIILGVLNYKIRYHSAKILGTDLRYGSKDEYSQHRLNELKADRDNFLRLVDDLDSSVKLELEAEIHIKILQTNE